MAIVLTATVLTLLLIATVCCIKRRRHSVSAAALEGGVELQELPRPLVPFGSAAFGPPSRPPRRQRTLPRRVPRRNDTEPGVSFDSIHEVVKIGVPQGLFGLTDDYIDTSEDETNNANVDFAPQALFTIEEV